MKFCIKNATKTLFTIQALMYLKGMSDLECDLCVIGGGINGAGIARDAAGRGLSVVLLEAKDLASGTSSASTKLVHGGLRYLEFLEFKLVRESLQERETLLRLAPHIIWPMEFILPHTPSQRPFWMIRLGLFLYDHLARRAYLEGSKSVDFSRHETGRLLEAQYKKGFSYYDCWVDDARLVVLNAVNAADYGAQILTNTACKKLKPHSEYWEIEAQGKKPKKSYKIRASMVVNAAGPWVRELIESAGLKKTSESAPKIRMVKGSHLILPRRYEGHHSYILQQKDGRITFVIPYERDYTLIGTTEEGYEGDPYEAMISDEEFEYLLRSYNEYFKDKIDKSDVIWTYSGVRPLMDDGEEENRKVSRDYTLFSHGESKAPMISVFGGKLTTYRVLAQEVVDKLLYLDNRYAPPWTDEKPLPGGDVAAGDFAAFLDAQRVEYPWLPEALLIRYARSYGTRMDLFLDGAGDLKDLGKNYGEGVYAAEVIYLIRYEFARSCEDILWRRSKLGVHVSEAVVEALEKDIKKLVKDYA